MPSGFPTNINSEKTLLMNLPSRSFSKMFPDNTFLLSLNVWQHFTMANIHILTAFGFVEEIPVV